MAPVGEVGLGLRCQPRVTCVLNKAAATTNWDAGGIEASIAKLTLSNENPQPSPCFAYSG
jgi:hypothetical protein